MRTDQKKNRFFQYTMNKDKAKQSTIPSIQQQTKRFAFFFPFRRRCRCRRCSAQGKAERELLYLHHLAFPLAVANHLFFVLLSPCPFLLRSSFRESAMRERAEKEREREAFFLFPSASKRKRNFEVNSFFSFSFFFSKPSLHRDVRRPSGRRRGPRRHRENPARDRGRRARGFASRGEVGR